MCSAQPIDLPCVRGPHQPEQQGVPDSRIGGQILGQEVQSLGGSSAHDHAPDLGGGAALDGVTAVVSGCGGRSGVWAHGVFLHQICCGLHYL
ncbi:hypothetical protein ACFFX0_21685 [Citricoccus parietis]|uniref:Uncharacterized protein n=1 Tax=Citricoccus parietis TaxID=592307 RepID=A0ABV5G4T8_9MICC